MAWRTRTARPLITLGVGLVLLNISVGIVKLATGRLGPLQTSNTHRIFDGGNIYPSGHVSNAVVLYGLVAFIATNHRRLAAAVAAFLSVTVGLGTVYRDTHWFSDVVGGWIAGSLVLIAVPWAMPWAERVWNWACSRIEPHAPWVRHLRTDDRADTAPPVRPPYQPPAPTRIGPGDEAVQPNETPVSSVATAHSFSPTRASLDARDDPTRRGKPRSSPIPSGP